MVFENRVKQLLAAGKTAWGASAGVADELATQFTLDSGIDFLWIDTEHSLFGLDDVRLLPVLARRKGCSPMIRVAGLDPNLIKKALDLGANTIMVPQVNNADEARAIVRAARYAPEGARGVSPNWTFFLEVPWSEYLPQANREICIVAQIESLDGIENIEAIAAVDGIDVLLAGPADLSAALGVIGQMTHPKLRGFLDEFPRRVAATGKTPGIALGSGEAAADAWRQGYRFINIGSLLFSGARGLAADLVFLRGLEA